MLRILKPMELECARCWQIGSGTGLARVTTLYMRLKGLSTVRSPKPSGKERKKSIPMSSASESPLINPYFRQRPSFTTSSAPRTVHRRETEGGARGSRSFRVASGDVTGTANVRRRPLFFCPATSSRRNGELFAGRRRVRISLRRGRRSQF